ncbi:MAG: hypothetical protein K8S54_15600 [Spirochaetia bacterium]|nr:hypothetical protein [Spirochaetia bacterium]
MSKRNLIFIGIGLVILLVIGFVLFERKGRSSNSANGDAQGKRSWSEFFGIGGEGEIRDGEPLSPKTVLFNSAKEYRERAKWPPYSLPITSKNDPVTEDFESVPPQMPHPDHPDGPFLVHYLPKNSFNPTEPLVVHAFLIDSDKKKIPFKGITATLTVGGANGKQIARMDMRDDGQTADEKGDLIYTAAFTLPPDLARDNKPANYIIVLNAQTSVGEILVTNAFNVGALNIRHTGKFSDSIQSDEKGNHLVVEPEFQIEKEGFYHIQGSLYSEEGEAIGWAQNRVKLAPGTHIIPLKFYGAMFCNSKTDGPYVLRNFAYANVVAMPGPRSINHKNLHKTQPYKASQFTCNSFEDPEMLAKAKQLEQDAGEEKQ